MRMVYISLNRQFGELLRATIEKHGVHVHIAHSYSHANRICDQKIDIALVDYSLGPKKGVDVIEELRDSGRLRSTEIWLTSYGHDEKSSQISEAMSKVKATRYWRQPFSPFDLLDVIEVKQNTAKRINFVLSSMRMIAQLWAHKTSGIISSNGSRLIFSEGRLVRQDPSDALKTCLQDSILEFTPISAVKGGDWEQTGLQLYTIALSSPPPNWIGGFHSKYTKLLDNPALYELLPIPDSTVKKLNANDLLSTFKISSDEKTILYTMWMMGILFFSDKPPANRKKVSKKPEEKTFNASSFRGRRSKVSDWLLTEYNRLKDASPATILGVPESAQSDLIQGAIKRMVQRYTDIVNDRTVDSDTKELAQTMVNMVQQAGREYFTIDESDTPEHMQLFKIGKTLMEAKNWPKAIKAFKKAHQMCIEDSSILAHLAWSEFNNEDSDMDKDTRQKDAQESLLLAVHLESDNIYALTFLAKMYMELGRPDAAIGPIRRVATLTPDPEVQKLRNEIEEAISSQNSE